MNLGRGLSPVWMRKGALALAVCLAGSGLLQAASTPLTLVGGTLPSAVAGTPYQQTLTAQGGTSPYTWARVGTGLPTGLSLSVQGVISGNTALIGLASFSVRVTDAAGATVVASYTLNVAPAPLAFGNAQLPAGVVGVEYPSQVLSPTGGIAPYTITQSFGSTPPGLTLTSGTLSGTPTAAGSYSFSIIATDSAGSTVTATLGIVIKPTNADIVLSATTARFNLSTGASSLPGATVVHTRSADPTQILNYTYAITPAATWLQVTGGTVTPGSLNIGLTSAALSLVAGTYTTSVVVTCTSAACSGDKDTVAVTLVVTTPPAHLSVPATLLSFTSHTATPNPQTQTFTMANTGGGTITVTSVISPDTWVAISGAPTALNAGVTVPVSVTMNPKGLVAGYYRSSIRITTSAGNSTVVVGLLVTSDSLIHLDGSGAQFATRSGSTPGNSSGTLHIDALGTATLSWNANVMSGAPWLSVDAPFGASIPGSPATVHYSINSQATNLKQGVYYGTVRVTGGTSSAPTDFRVVLNVVASNTPASATPQTAALVFVTQPGGTPAPQTVQVTTSSTAIEPFQTSATTNDGANWLTATPASGTMTHSTPGVVTVTASAKSLNAGVYKGTVHFAASSSTVRSVDVTLIVQSSGTTTGKSAAKEAEAFRADAITAAAGGCQPTQLVPTHSGLASGFSQAVSWPAALAVQIYDDCGNTITNGQVVATFSNGDPPLVMPLASDKSSYTATWIPRNTAQQVTVQATVTASGFSPAQTQIVGQVVPSQTPVLNPGGVLHVFAPRTGGALGPGNIVQIYGSNMASQAATSSKVPLPTMVNNTQVIIGGIPAPLYYTSAGQINAQVPFELAPNASYQIVINANGQLTTPEPVVLAPAEPGVASYSTSYILAEHADGSLVTSGSPAKPGEALVCFLAGMGQTDTPVASGTASPSDPLAHPQMAPTVTINGTNATVLFAGLTPTAVGLYQINFQVPSNAPSADLSMIVAQNGVVSNTTILPVRK